MYRYYLRYCKTCDVAWCRTLSNHWLLALNSKQLKCDMPVVMPTDFQTRPACSNAQQLIFYNGTVQIQLLQGRWKLLLLHSVLASWLNMAAAQAASRGHLCQTLQRVHMQRRLQAWFQATRERVWLKSAALYAWREVMQWQRQKPRLLNAALDFRKSRQVFFSTSSGNPLLYGSD